MTMPPLTVSFPRPGALMTEKFGRLINRYRDQGYEVEVVTEPPAPTE